MSKKTFEIAENSISTKSHSITDDDHHYNASIGNQYPTDSFQVILNSESNDNNQQTLENSISVVQSSTSLDALSSTGISLLSAGSPQSTDTLSVDTPLSSNQAVDTVTQKFDSLSINDQNKEIQQDSNYDPNENKIQDEIPPLETSPIDQNQQDQQLHDSDDDISTDSDDKDLDNIKPKTWAGWFILKGAKIIDWMDKIGEKVLGNTTYMDNGFEDVKWVKEKEKEYEVSFEDEQAETEIVLNDQELDSSDDEKLKLDRKMQEIEEGVVEPENRSTISASEVPPNTISPENNSNFEAMQPLAQDEVNTNRINNTNEQNEEDSTSEEDELKPAYRV